MEVCSLGPHLTGHADEPIDEEDTAQVYDDLTEKILPWTPGPSSAPGNIQLLNTLPMYWNVPEANATKRQGTSVGPVV